MKECSKCGEIKKEFEFAKNSYKEDNLHHICRKCMAICRKKYFNSQKAYAQKHALKIKKRNAIRYKNNKEESLRRSNLWKQNNKEKAYETHKAWVLKNKDLVAKSSKKIKLLYPERIKSRQKLNNEIRSKRIVRPLECSSCNKKTKINAHHHDYSKPLSVIWLCSVCHAKLHIKLKREKYEIT